MENAGKAAGYPDRRLQRIQDIPVSTMRGCEAAFLQPVEVPLPPLPDGRVVKGTFLMASLPQFLVMKGLAFHNREEASQQNSGFGADAPKDAYDIYFIVKNYPSGWRGLAELIRPHLGEPLLQESFTKIAAKWGSVGAKGPMLIAARESDDDERERVQRDAFEQVNALFRALGMVQ